MKEQGPGKYNATEHRRGNLIDVTYDVAKVARRGSQFLIWAALVFLAISVRDGSSYWMVGLFLVMFVGSLYFGTKLGTAAERIKWFREGVKAEWERPSDRAP